MSTAAGSFPIGGSITAEQLAANPYALLADLRENEPVSYLPATNAWFITGRSLALDAMRDAERFTVDDPRFSTGAVIGDSMLTLDGEEHARHRGAFTEFFRPKHVRAEFEEWLDGEANRLVAAFAADGRAEMRTALAGPFAVTTIAHFLSLDDADPDDVLTWYRHMSDAIIDVSLGKPITDDARSAVGEIHRRVASTLKSDEGDSVLRAVAAGGMLTTEELTSEAAVIMFGAIETSEGMTANLLWHLLTHPDQLAAVRADRTLVGAAIDESLRLEPAAAIVDRYATTDVEIGGVTIPERALVSLSLLAANRDPETFPNPDEFDITRENLRAHVTFIQGPHTCLGLHLARLETEKAINAVFDQCPNITLDAGATTEPEGLIFRKPASVVATWDT